MGGRGGILLQVSAAEQGMVFRIYCLKPGIQFHFSILNSVPCELEAFKRLWRLAMSGLHMWYQQFFPKKPISPICPWTACNRLCKSVDPRPISPLPLVRSSVLTVKDNAVSELVQGKEWAWFSQGNEGPRKRQKKKTKKKHVKLPKIRTYISFHLILTF